MAKAKQSTVGGEHLDRLLGALQRLKNAPADGDRGLPLLDGLPASLKAVFTGHPDTVLLAAIEYLRADGRVYLHGDNVVFERPAADGGKRLATLAVGTRAEPGAEGDLANVFLCRAGAVVFPPPRWLVQVLLKSDLIRGRLPRIEWYARRAGFDADFVLRPPGWHPDAAALVHGEAVEPVVPADADPSAPALDRLPPHLRTLLGGFCFGGPADLANALAMLLTGLLGNHFVDALKGVFLIDGNQPGLGKTLLARAVGAVLDGAEPRPIAWTADDVELEKRLGAEVRTGHSSVVLVDNGRNKNAAPVSSPVIESNSMAPAVSFRILGRSEVYTRPNDLLWVLTMNCTSVSPDLVSRGVPVRLAYEGKPEDRQFDGPDPARYARAFRPAVLGELAGMVVKWNQAGRPPGGRPHRCHEWAGIVGGILEVAGFPEFLGAPADDFNSLLGDLGALAEAVVKGGGPFVEVATHPPEEQ